jgi:pimeloyl-ACP methyl ester carboxylesterase
MSIAEHESTAAGSRVTSKDGTTLAVTAAGRGTPVILIGGAFNDRSTVAALAEVLAPGHTAVSYDRRGRSASDDRSTGFEVRNEIDDLAAVIAHVGGRAALFGHSSGAILALEAASRGLPVDRVAVYEPPLRVDDTPPYPSAEVFDELTDLVAAGDRDGAAAYFLNRILFVPEEAVATMRSDPSWAFLAGHAATLPYDVLLSRPWEVVDRRAFAALDVPVLAMYGDRTSTALEAGTRAVAEAVPGAELLAIPGQDHGVLQHPETLEPALAKFLAGR